MITSAFFELNESRKEIYRVLKEQASSLIETISLSSTNTLNSSYEIEGLIAYRLLDNARMIRSLDSLNLLTKHRLIQIGKENNLYRINIFDKNGNRVLTNRIPEEGHVHSEENVNRYEELKPILTGETNQLILGLRNAHYTEGQRYAVAAARSGKRGAIVINLDAQEFLQFRKKIGIGKIIKDIGNNSGIEYIVLQDSLGILAASTNVKSMNSIEDDNFLTTAEKSDSVFMRKFDFENHDVFEAVKRLKIGDDITGVYRIGISLDEIRNVEARMYNRIILITLLLAAISVIVLSIIFTSQNLKMVSLEYAKFKTFASSVLQNMAEAVIVIDNNFKITFFNNSSEVLFGAERNNVINKNITEVQNGELKFIADNIKKMTGHTTDIQKTITIRTREKHLQINIAKNITSLNEVENYTVVLSDITEKKKLEEQAERNEKLSAMGELASGVAHEIRNPINAIGMIAQRLNKEFIPGNDKEEYLNITKLLKDEVTRINKIITQFLSYAKPIELSPVRIISKKYFEEIYRLFADQAKEKGIELKLSYKSSNELYIDPELMKQALMNIIQNAIDASGVSGKVEIIVSSENNFSIIEISDIGSGISEDKLKKIFDLYYTTKKDGNGLGLSIAQKIIDQHSGIIEVESKTGQGTKFKIKLPIT